MKYASMVFFLLITLSSTAQAALGEREDSCENDRAAMSGTRSMTQMKSYRVHVIHANGDVIKEFVSAQSGQVFAVSWRGISHPNLAVLLGAHYLEFKSLAASTPAARGRAPSTIKTSKAMVMRGGHMRDVHGKAYMPDAFPAGVRPEELL